MTIHLNVANTDHQMENEMLCIFFLCVCVHLSNSVLSAVAVCCEKMKNCKLLKHLAEFYILEEDFLHSTNFTFQESYFIKHMFFKNFLLSPLTKNRFNQIKILRWKHLGNAELKCKLDCGFDLFQPQLSKTLRSRHSLFLNIVQNLGPDMNIALEGWII